MIDPDVRQTLRYFVLPCAVAIATCAAIVIPNPSTLGWGRLAAGLGVVLVLPAVLSRLIWVLDRRRGRP